jgi:hypothetical protein
MEETEPPNSGKHFMGGRTSPVSTRSADWVKKYGQVVIDHLKKRGKPVHLRDKELEKVVVGLGISATSMSPLFTDLVRVGLVKRQGRGLYTVA